MTDSNPIAEALELMVPPFDRDARDWDAIVQAAQTEPPERRTSQASTGRSRHLLRLRARSAVAAVTAAAITVPAAVAFHRQIQDLFLTPSVPSELQGTYTASVRGLHPPSLNGRWTLSFDALSNYGGIHGSYARARNGRTVATGGFDLAYSQAGQPIVYLRDSDGPDQCAENKIGGAYLLRFHGQEITLRLLFDTCAARRDVLLRAGTFTR